MRFALFVLCGLLSAVILAIAGWMSYTAWQDALVDVSGLHCSLTDSTSGEKTRYALMLRKRRRDEAPTSLWTQDADDARPKEIYKVCESTPDELAFKPTEMPCPAGYTADTNGKPTFDFTINRKTLELTIANRTPGERCEQLTPADIRTEWRKGYADKVRGNHF